MPARHPETELLLACAGTVGTPQTADRIGALYRSEIDWDRLLCMARLHKLMPPLYLHLSGSPAVKPPAAILERLRDHFNANHLRSLYLTGELLKLADEMCSRGVRALPYKGPVLASMAYGNLAFREFGDLDVLVAKGDVLGAREVLLSLGYAPQHEADPKRDAALLRYDREYSFVREDGSMVELHWTVAPRAISFVLDPADFWGRSTSVPLGGPGIQTLSTEDTILTLCVHGASHLWGCLAWVCDVAALARHRSLDWEALLARASATNTRRMLLLGLSLAHDLSEAELPEEVSRMVGADAVVGELSEEVRERMLTGSLKPLRLPEGVRRRFHLRAMERSRDRLRYLARWATNPTLADRERVSLPLVSLYRLFRPIRLGGELGRSLAGRLR